MHVVVVGGGIGGLVSALLLALEGVAVTLLEKEDQVGGKARRVSVDGTDIDAGPTVFTLRDIFDSIAERAGASLDDLIEVEPADLLARHAWSDGSRLDLFADRARSEEAIGDFAGAEAARAFAAFSDDAARLYRILDPHFMRQPKANTPWPLTARIGFSMDQFALQPFRSMWSRIAGHFDDPRLRQLFGRYATYCGSSPFAAPSTLMLIAHVEARGVWLIKGGLKALADALATLCERQGVTIRTGCHVDEIADCAVTLDDGERIAGDAVVVNADPAALASGRFGTAVARSVGATPAPARSLSALTWMAHAQTGGFALSRHNVFFSDDSHAEFADLAAGRVPSAPSVYVCAQDRSASLEPDEICGRERLQVIVNAPADGDTHRYSEKEQMQCTDTMRRSLERCGLSLERDMPHRLVTPSDYEALFPSTGGALYGRASHGWAASFRRQGARTKIPWLYCAGGATHPGAGVPMAALSGKLAVQALVEDRASILASRPVAMRGGMSTQSATTAVTG